MYALLAFAGLLFIFLEFFLPGSIMAIGGTVFLLASLLLFYFKVQQLLLFGVYFVILSAALTMTIFFALSRIKKSKVLSLSDQEGYQACTYPQEHIGKIALALSDLKPAGYIEIAGQSFAALSKLGYIDKGARVLIIGGQGTHLIVTQEKHDTSDHGNL